MNAHMKENKQTNKHTNKQKLERAVDGAPSQITTLKCLTHPHPASHAPHLGHDAGTRMKIPFDMTL